MLGTTLNHRYRLEQLLSRASSGPLYLATDERSGEMLAVKIFPPNTSLESEDGLRYRRAMGLLESVDHPHLLSPVRTVEGEGVAYQVLPYYPAEPLSESLRAGAFPLAEGVALLRQAAMGLAALHRAGVLHLNLKPSNLLVSREADEPHCVLTDPARGLLRGADFPYGEADSLACSAPEQTPWLGLVPDERSDLYALGALAYLIFTGKLPFSASTPRQMHHQHILAEPPRPRQLNARIPPRLEAILRALVEKQPRDRYQSAEGLLADLESWNEADGAPLGRGDRIDPFAAGAKLQGRDSAQEILRSLLARTASGQGSLVWLRGEHGAGKRSLVEALLGHIEAAQGLLLRATAPQREWCAPYALPVALLSHLLLQWETLPDLRRRDILYRLHRQVGESAAVLTALLPGMKTLLPDAADMASLPIGREHLRVLNALCEVFRALAEPRFPLVLWLGEFQWADADSREWLGMLAHRLHDAPILVIAGTTPQATPSDGLLTPLPRERRHGGYVHWVELPPLDGEQTGAHLAGLLGRHSTGPGDGEQTGLPLRLGRWMIERWGGSPLAQRLVLRLLIAKGLLRRSPAGSPEPWHCNWAALDKASWPESLAALIQHRLELVSDEVILLLQAAAVFPGPFPFRSLLMLLDHYPAQLLLERVEAAIAEGVLAREGNSLRFTHCRIRDALYRTIPRARLAHYHLLCGSAREAHPCEPPLAHHHETALHFRLGGDQSRYIEHGCQAVAAAWQQQAPHAVRRWSGLLQPLLRADGRLPHLYLACAIAHAQLGDHDRALSLLDSARAAGLSAEAELEAIAYSAWSEQARGDRAAALARIEEGLAMAGDTLPAHPVGAALARLTGAAMRHYESARLAAVGSTPPALDRRERWQIELLALASSLLASLHPVRAVLADEKILRLAGTRAPSPHLTGALVRLGEMHGDPEGDSFAQAGSLLEKHEFPHAQAAYFAAVGRCWLASGQLKRAKDNFAMALERFQRIGDPRGEAETVLSLIEADRVQGLCDDLIEQVAWLRRLTALLGAGALAEVSAGLEAYAGALAGQVPLATAGETMRSRAAGLDRLGDSVNACYLRALAGELALAAGDLSELLETVASAGDLRAGPLTAGAALLQGVMAETHLVQANALPDEAEYHLGQARDLLASIAAYHAHSGGFPSYFARLEAMEGFVREELPAALDRAGQAISELKAQGARLPLGWLQYRIAEGLKARDDPQWLHWGGRALTTFDATRAHLYTDATRRLLELPAPLDDDLGEALALGEPPPHGAPAGGSLFAGLLERLGGGGIVAPEQLHTEILRQLVSTADAEYGGLLQPDSDGHLTLLAQVPEDEAPVERFNGWLAESVWREGQGEVLENYQPSSTVVTASDFPGEAQSLICVPIAIRERTFAVVMLGSAMSRLVFDQTHLHRLSALGREAGIVLALDETLRRADGERVRLAAETSRQAHLLAWSVRAAEGDTQALLASYLTQTADCGPFSGALLCLGSPDGAQLEFAAWQGAPRQLASLDAHLPLPLAGGQAGEALRRQVPVPIHAVDRPPPSESEQRLLNAIGASDGIWLPLLHGGEAFGVVLLAAEEPGSGSSRQWEDGLFAPLRLITPALQKALQVEAHGREQAQWATEKQVVERERDLYRRFIPPGLGTTPAELEGSMAEGVERTLPVLIGEAPGLAGRLGLGKRELLTTVQRYFERVEQGLVLHQGVLDRIQHRQWIAHFAGDADGALWGAQTLHQMLLALRDEGSAEGIAFPPTGLGLHLGNTLWGALAAGARLVPLLTGAGIRTATRLAAMSISFRCGILVSQATVEALQEPQRFDLRQLGKLRPAAGESRIEVYELYSVRDEEVRAPMRALQGVWEEALRRYQLGQWRRAAGVFGHYLARLPQDRPARFFLRQCRQRAPG